MKFLPCCFWWLILSMSHICTQSKHELWRPLPDRVNHWKVLSHSKLKSASLQSHLLNLVMPARTSENINYFSVHMSSLQVFPGSFHVCSKPSYLAPDGEAWGWEASQGCRFVSFLRRGCWAWLPPKLKSRSWCALPRGHQKASQNPRRGFIREASGVVWPSQLSKGPRDY